ncbi:MAG: 16S rRNA processing protein RimM [Candidatus Lambdaproteobacteria bacterium]|nr:16S rRNA processing protein RimM [Candidatus Lambdaproteobacteria bacterium]
MALIDRERLVCVGKVVRAHGLKGELRVASLSDAPGFLASLTELYVDSRHGLEAHQVSRIRDGNGLWIVALEGVPDRDAAERLVGAELLVERDRLAPLEADQYFVDELIGCAVETLAGVPVGEVAEVVETGAYDMLRIVSQDGAVLVPMVGEVIREVDQARKRIVIDPPPGLLQP